MSTRPPSPMLYPDLPPRGACLDEHCSRLGICAGWAVMINGIVREKPLDSRELCGACSHSWISHEVGEDELLRSRGFIQRRGSPRSSCGGFHSPASPSTWSFDTLCDCGVELRAHLPIYTVPPVGHRSYTGAGMAQGQGMQASSGWSPAPPSGTFAPPGLTAPAPTAFAGTSVAIAAASPVAAFGGVRQEEPGATNDRRRASAERMHITHSADVALNVPRARTSAMTPRAATAASQSASSGAPSSLALPESLPGPATASFVVHMVPLQHPAVAGPHSLWPSTSLEFTDADYVKLVKLCAKFQLVFPAMLPAEGPVWEQLYRIVMDHCALNGLVFHHYDDTVPPTHPTELPFMLLSVTNKTNKPKRYNVNDSLNVTTFTAKSLRLKKFGGEVFPLPGTLAGRHMIRIVPRYGSVLSPLNLPHLHESPLSGLADYSVISCPEELHPCFPTRVLSALQPALLASCRPDCPQPTAVVAPAPAAPVTDEALFLPEEPDDAIMTYDPHVHVVGPRRITLSASAVEAPDDVELELSPTEGPERSEPNPPVAMSLSSSELRRTHSSGGPSQRQRRRRNRPGHMSTGGRPPAHQTRSQAAAAAAEVDDTLVTEDDDKENLDPAADGDLPLGATAGPSARAGPSASALGTHPRDDDDVGNTDGVHAGDNTPQERFRPSTRRRMFSPVPAGEEDDHPPGAGVADVPATEEELAEVEAAEEQADPHAADEQEAEVVHTVVIDPNEQLGEPLNIPSWPQFIAWTGRVVDAIPMELPPPKDPRIHAPDVDSAARILIFLIQWLLNHRNEPTQGQSEDDFYRALSEAFGEGIVCDVTTLEELLRHADAFEVKAGRGIGRSVLEAVIRRAVAMLLEDTLCFQDIGRFKAFRWFLDGLTPDPDRLLIMCSLGFLTMMCIVGGYGGPHPLSPYALRTAIEGPAKGCLMDMPFLRLLDTELYMQVRPWAIHDKATAIPSDNHKLLGLIIAGNMDFGNICGVQNKTVLDSIERAIFSCATLGTANVADFVDYKAFVEGMSLCFPGGDLDKLFEYRCRDYLALLCTQQLDDVDELLDHVQFIPCSKPGKLAIDRVYEKEFGDRVLKYLVGVGHPDHPNVRTLVGDERFASEGQDPLLRARLFLQMMTGSDLVPMNPSFVLKFVFNHVGRRSELLPGEEVPLPRALEVHACMHMCVVRMDRGLRNLLCEPPPYSVFNSWFHGAVLLPNTFNQV